MTKRKGQMVKPQKLDMRENGSIADDEVRCQAAKRFKHEYVLNDGMHTVIETDKTPSEVLRVYSKLRGKPNLTLCQIR